MSTTKRTRRRYESKVTACICEHCGTAFEKPTSEVARGKSGRFCSKRCVNFARDYERTPPEDRFWSMVDKSGPTPKHRSDLGPCWLWTGFRKSNGYGQFGRARGDGVYAHRFSFELANGPLVDAALVLHHCDNPPCVNPMHLYAGTHAQNTADMDARGRRPKRAFVTIPEESVRRIRSLAANGMSIEQIANAIGCSAGGAQAIISGRTRRSVA